MSKAIWVVNVDGYRPDVCKVTFPTIKAYADKIQASFNVITERRWAMSAPYEKMQVHKLGENNDWNIIIDADMYIHESMWDVTRNLALNCVSAWMCYDASNEFPEDIYFYRDQRKLGISTNFLFVPKACHDVLTPFSDEELPNIKIRRPFILDEYCVSRNMAKFGLKHSGILSDLAHPPFKHLNLTSGHQSHV